MALPGVLQAERPSLDIDDRPLDPDSTHLWQRLEAPILFGQPLRLPLGKFGKEGALTGRAQEAAVELNQLSAKAAELLAGRLCLLLGQLPKPRQLALTGRDEGGLPWTLDVGRRLIRQPYTVIFWF